MSRLFSFNQVQKRIVSTLTILILIVGSFYFLYLPKNEKEVNSRMFRSLERIHDNVKSKLDNNYRLLENHLEAYCNPNNSVDSIKQYINNYQSRQFELLPVKSDKIDQISKRMQTVQRKFARSFQLVNDAGGLQFTLEVGKADSNMMHTLKSRNNVTKFIEPLLSEAYFSEFLLLDTSRVIFETFPSGFEITKNDSLLEIAKGIKGRKVVELNIGGNKYKVFLQPITFDLYNKWLLCGLIKSEAYNGLKTSLPTGLVISLIMIASLAVLSIPLLKIALMGNRERLGLIDVVSFYFSFLFIVCIITYFIFSSHTSCTNHDISTKVQIANQLELKIEDDVTRAHNTLANADIFRQKYSYVQSNLTLVPNNENDTAKIVASNNFYATNQHPRNLEPDSFKHLISHKFHEIFWLDLKGNEINNWTTASQNPLPGNYFARNYFQAVLNNQTFLYDSTQLFLEPIQSWSSGTFRTVVSKKSIDSNSVACISFDLEATKNFIMQPGYQFAVIDNKGNVLYHTDASRNTQENFIDETEQNTALRSHLFAQKEGTFTANYYGKEHCFYIKPLKKLPYNILVFNNNETLNLYKVQAFSFAFLMLGVLLLINVVELLALGLLALETNKLKRNYKIFDTLYPNANLAFLYRLFSKQYIIAIIACMVSFQFETFAGGVCMILISINLMALFTQLGFYFLKPDEMQKKSRFKRLTLLTAITVFYNVATYFLLQNALLFYCIELGLIFSCFFLFNHVKQKVDNNLKHNDASASSLDGQINVLSKPDLHSYSTIVMLRLILIGALPIGFLYTSAYNFETIINTRIDHVELLKSINDLSKKINPQNTDIKSAIASVYFNAANDTIFENTNQESSLKDSVNDISQSLFCLFRVKFNKSGDNGITLSENNFTTNQFQFQKNNTSLTTGLVLPNNTIQIKSCYHPFFDQCKVSYYIVIIASSIAMLALVYVLLLASIRKLFSLTQPDVIQFSKINLDAISEGRYRYIFANGSPGSNKLRTIQSKLSANKHYIKDEVLDINFIKIPDSKEDSIGFYEWSKIVQSAKSGNFKTIILTHFEYAIADERINRIKLNFIEDLLTLTGSNNTETKLIIVSTVHQIAFLESLQGNNSVEFSNDLKRWSILLGKFVNLYLPLIENKYVDLQSDYMVPIGTEKKLNPRQLQLLSLMADECRYTAFLGHQMADIKTCIVTDKIFTEADELIIHIQNMAYLYYKQLWDSLTHEEQFIVLDLAEDGLVNTSDAHHLNVLMCKRIILFKNGRLSLFNTSFRNFVLTAINTIEAAKLSSQIKDTGVWSQFKTPLLLVVGVIAVFTFTSQQETYAQVISIMAMLSTFIPLLIRTSAIFSTIGKSSNT
jgi:hypothetical protein